MKNITVSYSVEGFAGADIPVDGIDNLDVRYMIESGPRVLTREQVEANARLIAAAPDLLEMARFAEAALSRVSVANMGACRAQEFNRNMVALRAAIAKAEGR